MQTHHHNTSSSTFALKSTIYNELGQLFWPTNLQPFKAFSLQSTGCTCLNTYLQSTRNFRKKLQILKHVSYQIYNLQALCEPKRVDKFHFVFHNYQICLFFSPLGWAILPESWIWKAPRGTPFCCTYRFQKPKFQGWGIMGSAAPKTLFLCHKYKGFSKFPQEFSIFAPQNHLYGKIGLRGSLVQDASLDTNIKGIASSMSLWPDILAILEIWS